jgi:hypothetical protein
MPDFLNQVIDEAATLIGEISVIHRQLKRDQKMTQQQLDILRHHAAQIVIMLEAVEID